MEKRILSLLLALVMLLSLSVTAFADAPNVNYTGGTNNGKFVFTANTTQYTDTDMFANFKNMMPGDSRTQEITLKNSLTGYTKAVISFVAVPHTDSSGDNAPKYKGHHEPFTPEELAEMQRFLDNFTLVIRKGDTELWSGSANIGGPEEDNWIELLELRRGESATLNVEIYADIEMNNDFKNHVGEVDWKFRAVEIPYEPTEPRTGDASQIWLYAAICLVSAAAIVGILVIKKKKAE